MINQTFRPTSESYRCGARKIRSNSCSDFVIAENTVMIDEQPLAYYCRTVFDVEKRAIEHLGLAGINRDIWYSLCSSHCLEYHCFYTKI